MSTYIVMIYGDEQVWESWSEDQAAANVAAHQAFNAEHGDHVVGGHQLDRSWTGRSMWTDADGRPSVTAGAYQKGPVVLGGYYLVEAPDLDQALRIAADLPEASAPSSGVEVRPLAGP